MGKAQGGGSGWVILTYSPRDKRLINSWAADHTTTVAGGEPILVLDMYEHAYQMDFGVKAADYVTTVMNAINWSSADRLTRKPTGADYNHYRAPAPPKTTIGCGWCSRTVPTRRVASPTVLSEE